MDNAKIKLKSILIPVKSQINFSIIASTISVIASISALIVMAFLADYLLNHSSQLIIIGLLLGLILILTAISIFSRLKALDISHFASYDLEVIIRSRLTQSITKMPLGEIYKFGQGTFIKVLQDDVKEIHSYVADAPPMKARAIAGPLMVIVALFILSWKLALIILAVVCLGGLVTKITFPDGKSAMVEYNQSKENISASIIEFVQAMPIVKIFDSGTTSYQRFKDALLKHQKMMLAWYKKAKIGYKISMCLLSPIPTMLAILWFGFYWWQNEQISFINWLAILLIGTGLIESFIPFLFLQDALQKAEMSIKRIQEIESIPTLPISSLNPEIKYFDIVFEHVFFKYQGNNNLILNDLSFNVPENSFTALVGVSGSGKSTIAKLIPRFWDTTSGSIKIGGVDIKDISPEKLTSYISFVFQDNFLFYDTIANNISYGYPDISREEIIEAAKKAQAHDFISQLPNGYDTLVGERGSTLSGGQRQRITIARAFLQNRPILVLDEVTAHADPENEALLIQAIAKLIKSKTVIMIAHRLSTIQNAHQIIVIDHGKIVEQGKHNDLLEKKQYYYQLWQSYHKAQSWQL